jgi:hypothetical protein
MKISNEKLVKNYRFCILNCSLLPRRENSTVLASSGTSSLTTSSASSTNHISLGVTLSSSTTVDFQTQVLVLLNDAFLKLSTATNDTKNNDSKTVPCFYGTNINCSLERSL